MTVTTSLNYKEYQADGMVTKFTIPFLLLDRSDLYVFIDNQPVTSGFTVTGLGNPISEIIFEDAPEGTLLLQRSITLIRETDYQENGDLLAKTVNQDFDRIYLAMQGFAQDTTKALRVTDAEGVHELPLATERANKTLAFDSVGQPILTTTATGSAAELAQRLVDASNENKGAGLVGYNKSLNYPSRTIGNAVNTLTDRFDVFEGNGVPLFAIFWWPSRASIPNGYIAADGQELSQATFPDAALAIQQGKVPTVQELEWQTDPLKRGSYVATSRQGYFRVPDYNGRYADSVGALFLRGDNGKVVSGEIQLDGIGTANVPTSYSAYASQFAPLGLQSKNRLAAALTVNGEIGWNGRSYDIGTINNINEVNLGNEETRPINVSGCWIIKLFGAVNNNGEVDLSQLITENANLAARLSLLESYQQAEKFTIIYPNGGTEDNPANVRMNERCEMDNPFGNEHVICKAEILYKGNWGTTGFIYSGSAGVGVTADQLGNKIIVQVGAYIMTANTAIGGSLPNMSLDGNPHPCRVKVWRVI